MVEVLTINWATLIGSDTICDLNYPYFWKYPYGGKTPVAQRGHFVSPFSHFDFRVADVWTYTTSAKAVQRKKMFGCSEGLQKKHGNKQVFKTTCLIKLHQKKQPNCE